MFLETKNLTKKFLRGNKELVAVNNLSIGIEQGAFAAVVGHSGSGKSTLFSMISGLSRPTSGEIFIDGLSINEMSRDQLAEFRRSTLSYVLQGQSLLGNFSIIDNICMPAYLGKHSDGCAGRALKLLDAFGLGGIENEFPSSLSGGEQRRVSIIRSLITSPKIIVADEPTSSLDLENTELIMQQFRQISQKCTTVLISTHDLNFLDYTDSVYKMSNGILL